MRSFLIPPETPWTHRRLIYFNVNISRGLIDRAEDRDTLSIPCLQPHTVNWALAFTILIRVTQYQNPSNTVHSARTHTCSTPRRIRRDQTQTLLSSTSVDLFDPCGGIYGTFIPNKPKGSLVGPSRMHTASPRNATQVQYQTDTRGNIQSRML